MPLPICISTVPLRLYLVRMASSLRKFNLHVPDTARAGRWPAKPGHAQKCCTALHRQPGFSSRRLGVRVQAMSSLRKEVLKAGLPPLPTGDFRR